MKGSVQEEPSYLLSLRLFLFVVNRRISGYCLSESLIPNQGKVRRTHWALALVKGIREPHEVKKKSFDLGGNRTHDLRIRSTVTLTTELRGWTEKVGFDSHRGQKIFSLPRVVP